MHKLYIFRADFILKTRIRCQKWYAVIIKMKFLISFFLCTKQGGIHIRKEMFIPSLLATELSREKKLKS